MGSNNQSNEDIMNAFEIGDVNELRNHRERVTSWQAKNYMIDVSVENGDVEMASFLMSECDVCPSLYAVQMAFIDGNHKTGHMALSTCHNKLRNEKSIKTVHHNYKKNGRNKYWSNCIPQSHQY